MDELERDVDIYKKIIQTGNRREWFDRGDCIHFYFGLYTSSMWQTHIDNMVNLGQLEQNEERRLYRLV